MCKPFLSFLGPSDPPIEARRRQPSDKITNRQIGAEQKILRQVSFKKIYFSKFEILKNKFIFSVSHLNLGAVVDPF